MPDYRAARARLPYLCLSEPARKAPNAGTQTLDDAREVRLVPQERHTEEGHAAKQGLLHGAQARVRHEHIDAARDEELTCGAKFSKRTFTSRGPKTLLFRPPESRDIMPQYCELRVLQGRSTHGHGARTVKCR
jgi:hypothetical protein